MTTTTEIWTGKHFEGSYRLGHVHMTRIGNYADVMVTRSKRGGSYQVEWFANGKRFARTEKTVDAAARFAAAKVETVRAWIEAQPERVLGLPGDWC